MLQFTKAASINERLKIKTLKNVMLLFITFKKENLEIIFLFNYSGTSTYERLLSTKFPSYETFFIEILLQLTTAASIYERMKNKTLKT